MELPTRGHDAVEILVNDHEFVKGLLEQLSNALDAPRRRAVIDRLKAALTVHNATEENIVYPAIAKIGGKTLESQRLYHETAAADVLMFELDTMLKEGDDSLFESKASMLRQAILEHMGVEEDAAFPHLREKAKPEQARLLTESVREFRAALQYRDAGSGVARQQTG